MRTQEQIVADCEARMRQLEQEYELMKNRRVCSDCQWYREIDHDGYHWYGSYYKKLYATCHEPLVKGFRQHGIRVNQNPMPCGKERALWQPKLSVWQKFVQLFGWK